MFCTPCSRCVRDASEESSASLLWKAATSRAQSETSASVGLRSAGALSPLSRPKLAEVRGFRWSAEGDDWGSRTEVLATFVEARRNRRRASSGKRRRVARSPTEGVATSTVEPLKWFLRRLARCVDPLAVPRDSGLRTRMSVRTDLGSGGGLRMSAVGQTASGEGLCQSAGTSPGITRKNWGRPQKVILR
jgi:hypothetical protein